MAAILSAIFKGVDEISSTFDSMANSGEAAVRLWESAGATVSEAFSHASNGAAEVVQAANTAAAATDSWTIAVGNYDKSALEAVYSTEELVEMGFKTQTALEAQAMAAEEAASKIAEQARAAEDAAKEQEKMGTSGADAIGKIEQALAAAGLTALLKETADAVLELTNNFSEAESIVVKATGATGEALEGLAGSMMNVYATTKDSDIDNTAGAIGEINTRLGLQGESLEAVTSNMMDYARITGTDVVGSVQHVTKMMKNWGVEVDDMEGLLDKLAYAGQASGISVDQLSNLVVTNKASLQQMGYSLDESIALLSMFEYEGLNSSTIMMGFRMAIKKFSDEGLDSSVAMQSVTEQIATMANQSAATSLAVETFGSRAGPELAYAIRSGKFEIEDWTVAIENSGGTLKTTAQTATTTSEKWAQATNSVGTAFSNLLSPAVNDASGELAGFVDGVGQFLNKYPPVTAALTAVGVALGVVATAFAGYTIATTVATAVTTAFGVSSLAALWPLYLVAAAIGAVVATALLISNAVDSANAKFNDLTATSKQQHEQLEDLNASYNEAVGLYGENSTEAQRLSEKIAGLGVQYEAGKMTIEAFIAENDALIESHNGVIASFDTSMESLGKEERNTTALIGQLDQLSAKTNRTASEQNQMAAIVDKLNQSVPGLALALDKTTGSLTGGTEAIRKYAEEQAKQNRQIEEQEEYLKLFDDRLALMEQLEEAEDNLKAAQERRDDASAWDMFWDIGKVSSDIETFTNEQERLQASLDETNAVIEKHEEAYNGYIAEQEKAKDAIVDYETAVSTAVAAVSADVETFTAAWDDAYAAARTSLDGTIGLFDTMKTESDLSTSEMIGAMESQLAYLTTYGENLQKASDFGLDEGLVASLADGSEESAGRLAAIVGQIESLGGSTAEATGLVAEFNEKFAAISASKDDVSAAMATLDSDVREALGNIQKNMTDTITAMNMSTEAGAAATATMNRYIADIKSKTGEARNAAAGVAAAVATALSAGGPPGGKTGYATGTTYAEPGVHLVGEEGPEVVFFRGGETVLNANDTRQSLSERASMQTRVPDGMDGMDGMGRNSASGAYSERKITIELAGRGSIDISGGRNTDEVAAWLADNLRPALIGVLRQEMQEEGDGAYDF